LNKIVVSKNTILILTKTLANKHKHTSKKRKSGSIMQQLHNYEEEIESKYNSLFLQNLLHFAINFAIISITQHK